MFLSETEFHEALSLEEAAALMARFGAQARLLAGGTDVLVDMRKGRLQLDHLVSINRIEALKGIEERGGATRIGALTTVAQLLRSPAIRERFPALGDAAAKMAGPQIRNMATVGGNLCNAFRCADLPPVLMVLGAEATLWSFSGQRQLPLAGFFLGPKQTACRPDEVLTEILIPHPPVRSGAAYSRFALRESNAIAAAGVAASLQFGPDGKVAEARLAISAAAPAPFVVEAAGALLIGQDLDEAAIEAAAEATMAACHPVEDIRGQADFRQALVGSLARTALRAAAARAQMDN
jgi:CO/xanthine dehydrogenase FAD-binding subunit